MSTRKEYKLTKKQLNRLKEASKPVPYMVFGGRLPRSPQENANDAWRQIAKEHGVKWNTIQPVEGKSEYYFSAIPNHREGE